MEVFIDLNKYLSSQNRIAALHLPSHFIILVVAVGKGKSGLRMQDGVDLVPVERNELVML